MKYWNDYITREDLETEPGMVDMDKIRALNFNTILRYIGDFVELGGNESWDIASEQVEDFMTDVFMSSTHVLEGRYPEPDEIAEYLQKAENMEARQYWTEICVHANRENWPDLVKLIREEGRIPEDVEIKNEKQRQEQIDKAIKDRKWIIREL